MQNAELICTFRALPSEHVILQSIILFLLVQYDGIHFIFINHDNFKFISNHLDIRTTTFLEEWDMPDKLRKVTWKWWLVSLSKWCRLQRFFHTFHMPYGEKEKKIIHHNFVNHKIFWSEIIGLKLSTSIKYFHNYFHVKTGVAWVKHDWASSLTRWEASDSPYLLIDCNLTQTIK